ncbi:hypothetical protein V8E36_006384 [Tilletia maclaganii]
MNRPRHYRASLLRILLVLVVCRGCELRPAADAWTELPSTHRRSYTSPDPRHRHSRHGDRGACCGATIQHERLRTPPP